MDHYAALGISPSADREAPPPPQPQVRSVQWIQEADAPPEAPRDWRWIAVLAAAGFAAFLAAMAVVTSGFAPVHVSPAFGGSPAPMPTTEAPTTTSEAVSNSFKSLN